MLDKISAYLNERNKKIYVTSELCDLANKAQGMITRERIVASDEKNIVLPGSELYFVNDEKLNALSTIIDNKYCILINKGIIEEQKCYLENLDWSFIADEGHKNEYIDDVIRYGFYFIVFHEYGHIFCGHTDAGLDNSTDKRAQECEADMFSMDYLINYVEHYYVVDKIVSELEKVFLAVYFLLEHMQKQNGTEWYNDRLIQNYYDEDRIEMRDHPLDAQRILYLYEMLNIVVIAEEIEWLPIKERVIEKLKILKSLNDNQLAETNPDYQIAKESIEMLKKTIKDIREKIPRIDMEG